ncbi:hypothetical protein QOZ80_6BG0482580 [Eleusine coracana subsp. coracana]|nr:hypothetical protein QOZ80_6BG0482580 [Eleusine coracana subsp. coracana]
MAGGVQTVSRRVVRPESARSTLQEPEEIMHLTPWDLRLLTVDYIQKGILLPKPLAGGAILVDDLASSLARALDRFYPLAGCLTAEACGPDQLVISLCCNGEGAELVHAAAPEVTASDIAASLYVPPVVSSFFPCNGMLGTDAVTDAPCPVLAAQVTELADGVFLAMSLNHGVADGTTFWHLFNTWAEIHRRRDSDDYDLATPPPVLDRWFLGTCPVPVPLPFGKVEDMVRRPAYGPVRECFFHFSGDSVGRLKAKANAEMAGTATATISSLQSLLAHLWRAACRARRLPPHRETRYALLVGCRARVRGVPLAYAGNAVELAFATSTAGEVEEEGLGRAAWRLNRAIASFDEATVRDGLASWAEQPSFTYVGVTLGSGGDEPASSVVTGSSPRFDVYGNNFGWGAPVTVRSGAGNKIDGKVTVYQGPGGGGGMALEVCLSHEAIARLVADHEFMDAVSTECYA